MTQNKKKHQQILQVNTYTAQNTVFVFISVDCAQYVVCLFVFLSFISTVHTTYIHLFFFFKIRDNKKRKEGEIQKYAFYALQ